MISNKADLLITTVNDHETTAVVQAFEGVTGQAARPLQIDRRMYFDLGKVNEASVWLTVTEMASGGVGSSHQAVLKSIFALKPQAVVAVGIAFGSNANKQDIGDLLISRQLCLYDLQRIGREDNFHRGDRPTASPWLLSYFRGVAQTSWKRSKFHIGLILSGDKLVDDMSFKQGLWKAEPEAIGGEMEGAGLYAACHDQKVDWILVKAICDWADGNKGQNKDEYQRLAAKNAADFVTQALMTVPLIEQGVGGDKAEYASKPQVCDPLQPGALKSFVIPKKLTDLDRDNFLDEAFSSISSHFETSLSLLERQNPHLKTRFKRVDANCFTAVVYTDDIKKSCKIRLANLLGKSITYCSDEFASDNTMNEQLTVKSDRTALLLEALGMPSLANAETKNLSIAQAADYYFALLLRGFH